ncbi:MAG: hypothetical protein IIB13_01565 [Chloroflexi bacterium]|nr:hypothetical protein [Chloroflexota bacterium]
MNIGRNKNGRSGKEVAMIAIIIRLDSDAVMVFDAAGEQVSRYQGQYGDVKEAILRDAPRDAVFADWSGYAPQTLPVPRQEW